MKRFLAPLLACALSVSTVAAVALTGSAVSVAAGQIYSGCPAGMHTLSSDDLARESTLRQLADPRLKTLARQRMGKVCVRNEHPELYPDVAAATAQFDAMNRVPRGTTAAKAYGAALRERAALARRQAAVPGSDGAWTPFGQGPLVAADPRYTSVNGEGLDLLSGRVDSLDYDPQHHRLFATIGTGGVWMSTDLGKNWRSIGDKLPTQILGAVGWSEARGGTVIVVSGEPLNGGDTYTGYGAYWSSDLGNHWHLAKGVPMNAMSYQVAVNPGNQKVVYVATSMGLFRSVDAGRHFRNVRLPTGPCAGKTGFGRCEFANFVTDVVVKAPGGTKHSHGGGVLAAVGYRAGQKKFPNGKQESPDNGLYRSKSGRPGTFKKLAADGFAPQDHIGRTELGLAYGALQSHNIVYAIVEDSKIFNEGQSGQLDAPDVGQPGVNNTVLNGIYVSTNFGKSWTELADTKEISDNPNSKSALAGAGQATLYAPGVQAWYNEWIKPDPTRQTKDGVPTRVLFGLEEVWQNRHTDRPQDGSSQDQQGDFVVVGPYYADRACQLNDLGLPDCPTQATTKRTTHPDQHDAFFVPDHNGGVTLLLGNDGGVFQQHVKKDQEIVATGWGNGGTNLGFHTLLPYDAQMAKDGKTWIGLQDNGSGYIDPATQKQYMAFGGDGFYTAVDPDHSNTAYSEYTYANMRVTTDGGVTWRDMGLNDDVNSNINTFQFANPYVMDPTDANHLLTAGTNVYESTFGPDTQHMDPGDNVCLQNCWASVFDLSTGPSGGSAEMSAVGLYGKNAYVGYCGPCDLLNHWAAGFKSGLATNVGGTAPPNPMTSDGWHFATAAGLPNRYITGIAIDPTDPNTVYVTLGGYTNREWVPPGSYLDKNKNIGSGHVYKSTDHGDHFTDISGNLPNAPAFTIALRGSQVIVGTKVGAFISDDANGTTWAVLGHGLPNVPINNLDLKPGDQDTLVAATYGRGVYVYNFPVPRS